METILQRVDANGVVGAGGAGFPSAVKLQSRANTFIVNAAECEPLLHKDKELLQHRSAAVLEGLRVSMQVTGAAEGVMGIKNKYHDVMDAIRPMLPPEVRIQPLVDAYPAGDEFVLTFDVLGKVIPPGGLPRDVGAAVANVETLMNIGLDQPVTRKYLTVAGAVRTPVTLGVPVGASIGEAIDAAGGSTERNFGVLLGGVMMGKLAESLQEPVTKTLGGIIVLPQSHPAIQWYRQDRKQVEKVGRSACDQCRFCTELCPRYLLGHPIQPHRAMQSLSFTNPVDAIIAGTLYCCECNLCSLYACPENLDPKNICTFAKPVARERELFFRGDPASVEPHPLNRERRAPMKRLMTKLALNDFHNTGPLVDVPIKPARVALPLKQHAGAPAIPTVAAGDRVEEGALIAAPAPGALGARIHASISGRVVHVDGSIVIERE